MSDAAAFLSTPRTVYGFLVAYEIGDAWKDSK